MAKDPIRNSIELIIAMRSFAADPSFVTGLATGVKVIDSLKKLVAAMPSELASLADELTKAARQTFDSTPNLPEDAEILFSQMVELSLPDAQDIVAANLQAEAVCDAMLAKLDHIEHRRPPMPVLFRNLTLPILDRVLSEKSFTDDLIPKWMASISVGQDEIRASIAELKVSEAEKRELQTQLLRVQSELGTTNTLLQGFLKTIVGRQVPPEEFASTLFRMAMEWEFAGKKISTLDTSHNMSPRLNQLKVQAMEAYEGEDTNRAWALLSEIEDEESATYERIIHERAELEKAEAAYKSRLQDTKAAKLAIAGAQLDVMQTVKLELEKLALVGGDFEALRAVQNVWYERGRDKGLRFDLKVAIALAEKALEHALGPDQRGLALNDLGITLKTLGERESGTMRLNEAVTAYTEALKEWTRKRVPLHWAATQNNLGNTLLALGEREPGTGRFYEAVDAYTEALKERTRALTPPEWATTQHNLGSALLSVGKHESGTARLHGAVAAYTEALKEWTRACAPLDWAMTQDSLGNALTFIGRRESGTERLHEAATAFAEALKERKRERFPLNWAITRNSLCFLEGAFFDKTGDAKHLDKAQGHLDAAREVFLEAQATHYLEKCEMQQKEIDTRRAR